MTVFALLLASAALLYAFLTHRQLKILREDLRHVHRAARLRADEGEKEVRRLDSEIERLRGQLRQGSRPARSHTWFTPYMTIQDALNLHPGVRDVLATLGIGGCSSCSVSARETLEQAAAGHGVDLEEMLAGMNALMRDAEPPSDIRDLLSTPSPETAEEAHHRQLKAAEAALPPTKGGRVMLGMAAQGE